MSASSAYGATGAARRPYLTPQVSSAIAPRRPGPARPGRCRSRREQGRRRAGTTFRWSCRYPERRLETARRRPRRQPPMITELADRGGRRENEVRRQESVARGDRRAGHRHDATAASRSLEPEMPPPLRRSPSCAGGPSKDREPKAPGPNCPASWTTGGWRSGAYQYNRMAMSKCQVRRISITSNSRASPGGNAW